MQERGTAEETWKTAVSGLKSSNEAPLAAIGFSDAKTNVQGSAERVPMKYNVFGAACSEVEVNLLTGEKTLLRSDILYDCGRSLNPAIDVGQVGPAHQPSPTEWVSGRRPLCRVQSSMGSPTSGHCLVRWKVIHLHGALYQVQY